LKLPRRIYSIPKDSTTLQLIFCSLVLYIIWLIFVNWIQFIEYEYDRPFGLLWVCVVTKVFLRKRISCLSKKQQQQNKNKTQKKKLLHWRLFSTTCKFYYRLLLRTLRLFLRLVWWSGHDCYNYKKEYKNNWKNILGNRIY